MWHKVRNLPFKNSPLPTVCRYMRRPDWLMLTGSFVSFQMVTPPWWGREAMLSQGDRNRGEVVGEGVHCLGGHTLVFISDLCPPPASKLSTLPFNNI